MAILEAADAQLASGNAPLLQEFLDSSSLDYPLSETTLMRQALALENALAGDGVALLNQVNDGLMTTADASSLAATLLATGQHFSDVSLTATTPQNYTAPQAKNGDCCAQDVLHWDLDGGTTIWWWGVCSNNGGCKTYGHFDLEAYVTLASTGPDIIYYHRFGYMDGLNPNLVVDYADVNEDITNSPDQWITSMPCTTSKVLGVFTCGEYTYASPTPSGHYYYTETHFHVRWGGFDASATFQSRRWVFAQGLRFQSYEAYGS